MAKTFFPVDFIMVDATRDYDDFKVEYKVSYGHEKWHDGKHRDIYKVQMVYDGTVNGRQSPSFPSGTDDMERVYDALRRLKEIHGG